MSEPGAHECTTRNDGVVVLARGESRRMGTPKGLLRLDEAGPTLAALVVELYAARGWPVALVTLPSLATAYRHDLAAGDVTVVSAPAGGGTALTVHVGSRRLAAIDPGLTHVWAHPVDLPLVAADTVDRLLVASRQAPDDVVRAAYGAVPGHPVVLPAALLSRLDATGATAAVALRTWLVDLANAGAMAPVRKLTVPDAGVIRDLDTPQAWRRAVRDQHLKTRRLEDDD